MNRKLGPKVSIEKPLTPENDIDTNGVLVDIFHGSFGIESVVALFRDGHQTRFDIEIAGELLECNLSICAHNDVWTWLMDGLSSSLTLLLPDALHGESAELNGLGRPRSGGTDGLLRRGCIP